MSFNEKDDEFDFYSYNWSSSVTFENRFFENKNKILEQVNFFLENPEYFEKKGIPYQLGMFIHGEPGCGKTSFIKALANLTGRHIIDIKLSDNMNLLEFKNIFLEERLAEDLYIPIDKRIYVLEDIDVMGNTVHKRKKKDLSTDLSTDFEMADSTDDEESLVHDNLNNVNQIQIKNKLGHNFNNLSLQKNNPNTKVLIKLHPLEDRQKFINVLSQYIML